MTFTLNNVSIWAKQLKQIWFFSLLSIKIHLSENAFSDVVVEDGVVSSQETFHAISLLRENLVIRKNALELRSSGQEI